MTKVTQMSLDEDGGLGRRRIHLREISGDSETPLETVGQDLRAARMRRGDDLATVSRALKIRKDHLCAVEEDDLNGLPGKTYAVGFVRSYAAYLGLDAGLMVERFKQEISGRQDEHHASAPRIDDEEGRWLPQGWRIVAGIVVLVLAYGAWHLMRTGPSQTPVPPAPSLAPAHPAPKPVVAPPAAQTEAVPSPAMGQSSTPPAGSQTNAGKPAPADSSGGTAMPSPAAVPAVPTGRVYGATNKGSRVTLLAKADTHIEVRDADGTIYINRNLKAGESYRVPNLPGLSLSSTNSGALDMELDGQMMGRAGADQETTEVNLDPQAIVDRSNSR
jgi:cytoskeleton protein RodZ